MARRGSRVISGRLFLPWHQHGIQAATETNRATQMLLSGSPREREGAGRFLTPRKGDGEGLPVPRTAAGRFPSWGRRRTARHNPCCWGTVRICSVWLQKLKPSR